MSKPVLSLPSDLWSGEAGIYVHWPFCEKKCPYCDFNSHVRDEIDQTAWRKALTREIQTFAGQFPNLTAKSIFFGGGTPSLMAPETTAAIIETIQSCWDTRPDIEITLEANPSSVEASRFSAYRQAGVNRVSLGVQSLNDKELKFLGRLHSASSALSALEVARNNFDRVSFDLIYALPDQSLESWRSALTEALAFSPSHLSLYQLTIEEGTAFHLQYARGKFSLPDEELAADLYALTQELCEVAGLPAYETSNHAKPGEESQHNLVYWRGQPYIGVGPGAHGRLPKGAGGAYAHMQAKRPERWLDLVDQTGHGLSDIEDVSPAERAIEAIMMGLRLREGIDKAAFRHMFGQTVEATVHQGSLNNLSSEGYIENTDGFLRATMKGRLLVNHLLEKLLA